MENRSAFTVSSCYFWAKSTAFRENSGNFLRSLSLSMYASVYLFDSVSASMSNQRSLFLCASHSHLAVSVSLRLYPKWLGAFARLIARHLALQAPIGLDVKEKHCTSWCLCWSIIQLRGLSSPFRTGPSGCLSSTKVFTSLSGFLYSPNIKFHLPIIYFFLIEFPENLPIPIQIRNYFELTRTNLPIHTSSKKTGFTDR